MRPRSAPRETSPKRWSCTTRRSTLAPQYGEGYRQRALTLVALGNPVQAQADYNRFLALNPQAPDQVQQEVTLFEQSGRTPIGQAEAASYSYGATVEAGAVPVPPVISSPAQQFAEARFAWAEDAFQNRNYDAAFRWALNSYHDVPQARTRALIAQILFAKGDYRGAAAEARAAVAMGAVMDWQTFYSYYGYASPRFSRQFESLKEFVRQNPSSADGHFLLGYEQMILGHAEPAHAELAIAAVIEPTDVVATNLLAKDGVEIVRSHRPLAEAAAAPGSDAVTANRPTPPAGVVPPPLPRREIFPTNLQAHKLTDLR